MSAIFISGRIDITTIVAVTSPLRSTIFSCAAGAEEVPIALEELGWVCGGVGGESEAGSGCQDGKEKEESGEDLLWALVGEISRGECECEGDEWGGVGKFCCERS